MLLHATSGCALSCIAGTTAGTVNVRLVSSLPLHATPTPSPCLAIADSLFAWVFNPDRSRLLTDTAIHHNGHRPTRGTAQRASPVRPRALWAASATARVPPFAPIDPLQIFSSQLRQTGMHPDDSMLWLPELQVTPHWVKCAEEAIWIPIIYITDKSAGPDAERLTLIHSHENGEDLSKKLDTGAVHLSQLILNPLSASAVSRSWYSTLSLPPQFIAAGCLNSIAQLLGSCTSRACILA